MNFLKYFLLMILLSCGTSSDLRNTKKLIKEGHASLYKNGALKVPYTEVKLIPEGPDTIDYGLSLISINAKDSLLLALSDITSTYNFMKVGVKKSLNFSKNISNKSTELTKDIHNSAVNESVYLIKKSAKFPKEAIVYSIELTKKTTREMKRLAKDIDEATSNFGEETKKEFLYGGNITAYKINSARKTGVKALNKIDKNSYNQVSKAGDDIEHSLSTKAKDSFDFMWDGGYELDTKLSKIGSLSDDELSNAGDNVRSDLEVSADSVDSDVWVAGEKTSIALKEFASKISSRSEKGSKEKLSRASKNFIQGYVSFPKKVGDRIKNYGGKNLESFSKGLKSANTFREKSTDKISYIFSNEISKVGDNIEHSLEMAKKEITKGTSSWGITLGLVKSLSWLTKALVWDAIIKPVGVVSASAIGYVAINGVAYPTLLVFNEGVATTKLAVQLVYDATSTTYNFLSPTVEAGLASVISFSEYFGGKAAAGGIYLASNPIEWGIKISGKLTKGAVNVTGATTDLSLKTLGKTTNVVGKVSGKSANVASKTGAVATYAGLKTSGKVIQGTSRVVGVAGKVTAKVSKVGVNVAGKSSEYLVRGGSWLGGNLIEVTSKGTGKLTSSTIRYIGVPLTTAVVPTAGGAVGVAVGGAGIATGTAYYAGMETAAGGSFVAGQAAAGTTAIVGSATSIALGTGLAAYETVKGIAVPSSYTLGSGLVLTYGQLTQLMAQTVLAASDAAYLVLSMEGPHWVLYSVKGLVSSGENLKKGAIVDLEKLQNDGEEIKKIPVSHEEVQKVIQSLEKSAQ